MRIPDGAMGLEVLDIDIRNEEIEIFQKPNNLYLVLSFVLLSIFLWNGSLLFMDVSMVSWTTLKSHVLCV